MDAFEYLAGGRPVAGTGPVGFGDREIPRNRVTVVYKVDRPELKGQQKDALAQKALIPVTSDRQLGIEADDALVRRISRRQGDAITAGELYGSVFSSFNGRGKRALEKYPHDPKRQIALMMSEVEWAGLAVETKEFLDIRGARRDKEDLAGVIFGTYTFIAVENLHPGDYVEWRLPAPRDAMKGPVSQGTPDGKVVLEPRARTPEMLWDRILMEVQERARVGAPAVARDRDANLVLEDAWQHYYTTMQDSLDVYFLLRLKQLVDVRAIDVVGGDAPEYALADLAAGARNLEGVDVVLALARFMGRIPGADARPGEAFTPAKGKNYQALNHDAMKKFYYDGRIENHAFHFDPANPNNPWPSARAPSREPAQRLTQKQLVAWKALAVVTQDADASSRRFVKGKCYAGAAAGGSADVILTY